MISLIESKRKDKTGLEVKKRKESVEWQVRCIDGKRERERERERKQGQRLKKIITLIDRFDDE